MPTIYEKLVSFTQSIGPNRSFLVLSIEKGTESGIGFIVITK